ncbi:chromosome partitioning protein ParA [Pseudomonas oryzihabitans]|nr:chromosome partitioning protein ParA [Pseudomonas psychrotolerans]
MTTSHLQEQLDQLRQQLDQDPPASPEDREDLELLIRDIEFQLANEDATYTRDGSLVDGVNLAVERFEASHPTMAGTLRSIMNSLSSMGI